MPRALAVCRFGWLRPPQRYGRDSTPTVVYVPLRREDSGLVSKTSKGKYVYPARIEEQLTVTGVFESVAVFGAGFNQPFALAVLSPERRDACLNPSGRAEVEAEIEACLERVNANLELAERVSFITVSQEPWTTENGYLTPTLKVRRFALEQHYTSQFQQWELAGRKVFWLEAQ